MYTLSFVKCGGKIDCFGSKVSLPKEWTDIDTGIAAVPAVLIVNVQVVSSIDAMITVSFGLILSCLRCSYHRIFRAHFLQKLLMEMAGLWSYILELRRYELNLVPLLISCSTI
jgi:hypothetical protein